MSHPPAAPPSKAMILIAFGALYLVWGSTFLGMRIAVVETPPLLMSGIRYGTAGVLLYLVSRIFGAPRPTWVQWRACGIIGLALVTIGNGGTAIGIKYIPSSLGALLAATIPMFLVLFAWWSGSSPRPRWSVCIGLVLGFLGVGLLLKPGNALLAGESAWIGCVTILCVSAIWALGSLYLKRIPKSALPASLALGGGMQMLCGGGALLIAATLCGDWASFHPTSLSPRVVWALVYLMLAGSIIGFMAYTWLLQVCDTAKVGTYAFVNPVVAVFLGWWIEREPVGPQTLVGAAFIITGAVLIILRQTRQTKPLPTAPTVAE